MAQLLWFAVSFIIYGSLFLIYLYLDSEEFSSDLHQRYYIIFVNNLSTKEVWNDP